VIEAEPAVALLVGAVAFEIPGGAVVEHVMLAGDVVDAIDLELFEQLRRIVEFLRLGQVGDVAGVDDEGRPDRQGIDHLDGAADGARNVGVGFAFEAEMSVADLHEREAAGRDVRRLGVAD
jgi:hypothetical protein